MVKEMEIFEFRYIKFQREVWDFFQILLEIFVFKCGGGCRYKIIIWQLDLKKYL